VKKISAEILNRQRARKREKRGVRRERRVRSGKSLQPEWGKRPKKKKKNAPQRLPAKQNRWEGISMPWKKSAGGKKRIIGLTGGIHCLKDEKK